MLNCSFCICNRRMARVILALAFVGSFVPVWEQSAAADYNADTWRRRELCGVNACYTFLKLHGRDVDYATLKTELGSGERGSNLQDLWQSVCERGLCASIV